MSQEDSFMDRDLLDFTLHLDTVTGDSNYSHLHDSCCSDDLFYHSNLLDDPYSTADNFEPTYYGDNAICLQGERYMMDDSMDLTPPYSNLSAFPPLPYLRESIPPLSSLCFDGHGVDAMSRIEKRWGNSSALLRRDEIRNFAESSIENQATNIRDTVEAGVDASCHSKFSVSPKAPSSTSPNKTPPPLRLLKKGKTNYILKKPVSLFNSVPEEPQCFREINARMRSNLVALAPALSNNTSPCDSERKSAHLSANTPNASTVRTIESSGAKNVPDGRQIQIDETTNGGIIIGRQGGGGDVKIILRPGMSSPVINRDVSLRLSPLPIALLAPSHQEAQISKNGGRVIFTTRDRKHHRTERVSSSKSTTYVFTASCSQVVTLKKKRKHGEVD